MDKIIADFKTNWKKYAAGLGIGAGATLAVLKATKKI